MEEDWKTLFEGSVDAAQAFLDSPSRFAFSHQSQAASDHTAFFKDFGVEDEGQGDRVDLAMDEDSDGRHDMEINKDEEVARKLDYQFRSYNLRSTNVRDGKSVWITWLDADDSGNYDPTKPEGTEERMGRPLKRSDSHRRRRRSSSVQHSRDYISDDDSESGSEGSQAEPRAATLSRLAARQQGASITVTFELTTKDLKELAVKIPDNWPGAHHNKLSDEHYRFLAEQINKRNNGWKPYNLRRRDSLRSQLDDAQDEEDSLILPEGRIPHPFESDQVDIRHHPFARGCKACLQLDHNCSLLEDEFTWPCLTCADDDCECELLVAPERRKTCEDCRRKRKSCSYVSMASDPTKPCDECVVQGFSCVAGPDPTSIRERISYDKDYSQAVTPIEDDRKYVTCTECRSEKKRCSLRNRYDMPPCDSCHSSGIACTFQELKRKSSNNLGRSTARKRQAEATNDAQLIRTALNHPVLFLHEEPTECTWCTQNIGILGHGTREIVADLSADGLSYTEVSGGENEDGSDSDRMCIQCTMERCRVVGCVEHELRPIEGANSSSIDVEAMFARTMDHSPALPEDRWCAVCPSPAFYECCTTQDLDMWGNELDPRSKDAEGCGLILCENCAVCYGELGDLEEVIDAVNNEEARESWYLGLRADAEFLKREGLLVRNVMGPPKDGEAMEIP